MLRSDILSKLPKTFLAMCAKGPQRWAWSAHCFRVSCAGFRVDFGAFAVVSRLSQPPAVDFVFCQHPSSGPLGWPVPSLALKLAPRRLLELCGLGAPVCLMYTEVHRMAPDGSHTACTRRGRRGTVSLDPKHLLCAKKNMIALGPPPELSKHTASSAGEGVPRCSGWGLVGVRGATTQVGSGS